MAPVFLRHGPSRRRFSRGWRSLGWLNHHGPSSHGLSSHSRSNPRAALALLLLGPAALAPLLLGAGLNAALVAPARALEVRDITYFRRPPWKVDLVSYYTNVWDSYAEYYFTIELAADAGASLGEVTIQQTRGADWQFPFAVERTHAFLGRPRGRGAAVPVNASFDPDSRRFSIRFPEPVAAGNTVTVAIRPWYNPSQADTYLFQVTAYPAGPNPSPAPLGFGTLRIYNWSDIR